MAGLRCLSTDHNRAPTGICEAGTQDICAKYKGLNGDQPAGAYSSMEACCIASAYDPKSTPSQPINPVYADCIPKSRKKTPNGISTNANSKMYTGMTPEQVRGCSRQPAGLPP